MTKVTIEGLYNVDAENLWRHVVRYDALATVMNAGAVRVVLPAGEEQVGDDLALTFRLWGVVPVGWWRIRVVARDDARMRLKSEESGVLVRRWAPEIVVAALSPSTSRLSDTIEIDAGLLTPLIARFARGEYAARHLVRKGIVEGARGPESGPPASS